MSVGVLFLLLLKATLLSFSGFGSLPVLRDELVLRRGVLTDGQLNQAVAVARITPGPMGSYVVAAGYAVAGWRGAVAGWAAMVAPALAVLPILVVLQQRSNSRRWRSAMEGLILASAALVIATAVELFPSAIDGINMGVVAALALGGVLFTNVPSMWVIGAGAVAAVLLR
jgi:chromate transporter